MTRPRTEEERQQALQVLDDQIGQALRESEANGELRSAPSWGKPMPADAGWEQTPDALKMPMKILKDAGVLPPEVELMKEIAALQAALDAAADEAAARPLRARLQDKRQALALRLERLRMTGTL